MVLRIAVIGAGEIARNQHLPALSADPRFAVVAVVDPRVVDLGPPCFPNLEALLAEGIGIDAVSICTPPQVRGPIALAALAAGLHVMLEKPPAATAGEAARLRAACPKGQTLFAAWHSRQAPMVPAAAAWLAGRSIAQGTMRWRENARQWHPGQHWLWKPGGLGVFDPAINGLSILTAITSQPFAVTEARFEVPGNQNAPIAAQVTLACGSGACGTGTFALDLDFREPGPPCWDIEIETRDGGHMLLAEGGKTLTLDGGAPQSAPEAEYAGLYDRFADLVARGESDVDTGPLALVADAFLMARITLGEAFEP